MTNIPSITFEMETSWGLGQSSTGPLLSYCKHFTLKLCTWGLAGMSRTWRSPCKTLHNRNTCTTMLSLIYTKVRFTSAFSQGQYFSFPHKLRNHTIPVLFFFRRCSVTCSPLTCPQEAPSEGSQHKRWASPHWDWDTSPCGRPIRSCYLWLRGCWEERNHWSRLGLSLQKDIFSNCQKIFTLVPRSHFTKDGKELSP